MKTTTLERLASDHNKTLGSAWVPREALAAIRRVYDPDLRPILQTARIVVSDDATTMEATDGKIAVTIRWDPTSVCGRGRYGVHLASLPTRTPRKDSVCHFTFKALTTEIHIRHAKGDRVEQSEAPDIIAFPDLASIQKVCDPELPTVVHRYDPNRLAQMARILESVDEKNDDEPSHIVCTFYGTDKAVRFVRTTPRLTITAFLMPMVIH